MSWSPGERPAAGEAETGKTVGCGRGAWGVSWGHVERSVSFFIVCGPQVLRHRGSRGLRLPGRAHHTLSCPPCCRRQCSFTCPKPASCHLPTSMVFLRFWLARVSTEPSFLCFSPLLQQSFFSGAPYHRAARPGARLLARLSTTLW